MTMNAFFNDLLNTNIRLYRAEDMSIVCLSYVDFRLNNEKYQNFAKEVDIALWASFSPNVIILLFFSLDSTLGYITEGTLE